MTKTLKQMMKLGGMLTVVLGVTAYNPLKASAQLLPDLNILEGGQACLAFCSSPRTTSPQAIPPGLPGLPPQALGGLPGQIMQLPGQVLQLPQQILSSQNSQVLRSNAPILPPGNTPILPPGNLPGLPPGNPPILPPGNAPIPQPPQAAPARRPSFIQKIAPVLPQVIQQLSR